MSKEKNIPPKSQEKPDERVALANERRSLNSEILSEEILENFSGSSPSDTNSTGPRAQVEEKTDEQ
jgi:hypothetical protein